MASISHDLWTFFNPNLFQVMIGIFLVSVNVFSAQLWSETCKKFSPIEYLECTVFVEDDTVADRVYLPDILREDAIEEDHNKTSEKNEEKTFVVGENDVAYGSGDELIGSEVEGRDNGDTDGYGTFNGK